MNKLRIVAIEFDPNIKTVDQVVIKIEKELSKNYEEIYCSNIPTIVILPENFMGYPTNLEERRTIEEQVQLENFYAKIGNIAQKYKVYILLGSIPYRDINNKLYIASILLDKTGVICAKYFKNHLFKASIKGELYDENLLYENGKDIVVYDIDGIKIGLSICFDLRFPEHYSRLRKQGAQVLLVPAAFNYYTGQLHWEVLLRSRAIENQSYVIGIGLCGDKNGKCECYGHSLIVDPNGVKIAEMPSNSESLMMNLDIDKLEHIREEYKIIC